MNVSFRLPEAPALSVKPTTRNNRIAFVWIPLSLVFGLGVFSRLSSPPQDADRRVGRFSRGEILKITEGLCQSAFGVLPDATDVSLQNPAVTIHSPRQKRQNWDIRYTTRDDIYLFRIEAVSGEMAFAKRFQRDSSGDEKWIPGNRVGYVSAREAETVAKTRLRKIYVTLHPGSGEPKLTTRYVRLDACPFPCWEASVLLQSPDRPPVHYRFWMDATDGRVMNILAIPKK